MNYEPLPKALGDNITDIEVTYNASSCNTETSLDNSMMTTVKGLYIIKNMACDVKRFILTMKN